MNAIDIASALGLDATGLAARLGIPRSQAVRLILAEEAPDLPTRWALVGLMSAGPRGMDVDEAMDRPTGDLAESLSGDAWAARTSRVLMPFLVRDLSGGARRTVTYGEAYAHAESLGAPDVGTLTKMAHPCGRVAQATRAAADILGERVPPLTAIVVNAKTGLPSAGIDWFVEQHLADARRSRHLSNPEARRRIMAEVWEEVWEFQRWEVVMSVVGLVPGRRY